MGEQQQERSCRAGSCAPARKRVRHLLRWKRGVACRINVQRHALPSRGPTHYDFDMTGTRGTTASNDDLFRRFVEDRREGLTRFLVNLGVGSEDARDIVQDGMMRLLRYKDSSPADEWTPLSYRIVLNLHRDRLRRESTRGTPVSLGHVAWESDLPSTIESPEQLAIDRQHLVMVRDAIQALSPRCREVYLLNRVDGLTYPAIADRCGISVKAVEKHISNALRDLRRRVDRRSGDKAD